MMVVERESNTVYLFDAQASPWAGDGDAKEGGLFPIDIAWKEERVALELDGPTHFLTGGGKRDGPTKAKSLLLKELGWTVERLAWFNWKRLETMSKEEQKSFWTAKLGRSGIGLGGGGGGVE